MATQYTTPLSSDSSQALPTFPPRPTSLPLQYTEIPRRNWVKQLKDEEPKDKNLNFFYSCLSLDLMRLLVSHCVTTSWLAAVTEMRLRASWAMHPKVSLHWMLFLPQLYISGLGNQLRICRLAHLVARLLLVLVVSNDSEIWIFQTTDKDTQTNRQSQCWDRPQTMQIYNGLRACCLLWCVVRGNPNSSVDGRGRTDTPVSFTRWRWQSVPRRNCTFFLVFLLSLYLQ